MSGPGRPNLRSGARPGPTRPREGGTPATGLHTTGTRRIRSGPLGILFQFTLWFLVPLALWVGLYIFGRTILEAVPDPVVMPGWAFAAFLGGYVFLGIGWVWTLWRR